MITRAVVPCLSLILLQTAGRFDSGDLKGFTKSKTEHIIVYLDRPFTVKAVRGVVTDEDSEALFPNVLVEVRGPAESEKIRATNTDDNGEFKFEGLPEGSYRFKVTFDGFRSVTGTIVVSKGKGTVESIKIRLLVGV